MKTIISHPFQTFDYIKLRYQLLELRLIEQVKLLTNVPTNLGEKLDAINGTECYRLRVAFGI